MDLFVEPLKMQKSIRKSDMKTYFLRICIFLISMSIGFSSQAQVVFDQLIWADECDGSGMIDTSKWHHQTILPNGTSWFNGELQHYTNRIENSHLDSGYMHITARQESFTDQGIQKNHTSARLNSKFAFTYGKVEVRAKLPSGAGTWPAIWMLGQNITETGAYWQPTHGNTPWPACGEIDIMEHWGINPYYVSSAIHTPSSFGGTVNVGGTVLATALSDFHVYSMEWTPESLTFKIDGQTHYTYAPAVQNPQTWPFDQPQFLLLNVAITPDIQSNFSASAMIIDYVRVYQSSLGYGDANSPALKPLLSPNPSHNYADLVFASSEWPSSCEMRSATGETVRLMAIEGASTRISTDGLSSGLYFLHFPGDRIAPIRMMVM